MNLKNFNLNLLVIFESIWVNRNLTRVAETLHMTQPGVSAALTRLRTAFEDPLFSWDGTGMTPTQKARQLAPKIHALLANMEEVMDGRAYDIAAIDREFMLASADYVFADLGGQLLRRMRQQAPAARLCIANLDLSMFEHSERFGVDLMIAPDLGFFGRNLATSRLYEDTYVGIAAADNHSVADEPNADEFMELPKIYFNSSGLGVAHHETMALDKTVLEGSYTMLTYSYLTIPFLLQSSDCVAMVPRSVATMLSASTNIRIFRLPQEMPPLTIYMYWPPQLTTDKEHAWLREQVLAAVKCQQIEEPS